MYGEHLFASKCFCNAIDEIKGPWMDTPYIFVDIWFINRVLNGAILCISGFLASNNSFANHGGKNGDIFDTSVNAKELDSRRPKLSMLGLVIFVATRLL